MNEDRVARLSEGQRECLRLVGQGLQTREIAHRLNLSHTAVVERLRAARQTLNTSSSLYAARVLASSELGGVGNISHVDTRSVVVPTPDPVTIAPPVEPQGPTAGGRVHERVHEHQAPYFAEAEGRSWQYWARAFVPFRIGEIDRDPPDLIKTALRIAVLFALIAGGAKEVIEFIRYYSSVHH